MSDNSNQEEISKKDNSNLIGTLLVIPIYIYLLVFSKIFELNTILVEKYAMHIFGIIIYLPIITGIIISFKTDKNFNVGKAFIVIFLLLSVFNFYNTYFVDNEGWNGLGFFIYWLVCTGLYRISAVLYYESFVGWKKTLKLLGIYVLSIAFTFLIGVWR